MIHLSEIEKVFSRANFILENPEDICDNINSKDDEGKLNTLPFLGIKWQNIPPILWEENISSPSFFTPKAFYYYTPSLIYCSFVKGVDVSLSMSSFFTEFIIVSEFLENLYSTDEIKSNLIISRYSRICQFSVDELKLIRKWVDFQRDYICHPPESIHGIKSVISYIIDIKNKSIV